MADRTCLQVPNLVYMQRSVDMNYRLYALDSPSPEKRNYFTAHPPPPQGGMDLFLDLAHTLVFRTWQPFWPQCPQISGSRAPTHLLTALPNNFARP